MAVSASFSPFESPQPEFATTRLLLRPLRRDDGPAVEEHVRLREIAEMTLNIPHPYPEGGAAEWIATHEESWKRGEHATFGVFRREDGALVGVIGLAIEGMHSRGELGYWVGMPYWNHGYCTEAARAVVEFAFRRLRLNRLQARHITRNPASGRVMQKLGMIPEGVHRESVLKWGRFEDLAVYALLAREWSSDLS